MATASTKKSPKLTAKRRNRLAKSTFAEPGKRKYPMDTPNRARNALSRVAQHGSPAEQKQVRSAVHRKYPSIGSDSQKGKTVGGKMNKGTPADKRQKGKGGTPGPKVGSHNSKSADVKPNPFGKGTSPKTAKPGGGNTKRVVGHDNQKSPAVKPASKSPAAKKKTASKKKTR